MVIAIFGIILLLAFLPRIIEALGFLQNTADKTQEQIQEEKEQEIKREEKGALANTVDFIFGEGTAADLAFDKPPDEDQIIKNLNQSATEIFETKVTFDPSTKVTSEGIITAGSPPQFELTTQDILTIKNRQEQLQKSKKFQKRSF